VTLLWTSIYSEFRDGRGKKGISLSSRGGRREIPNAKEKSHSTTRERGEGRSGGKDSVLFSERIRNIWDR